MFTNLTYSGVKGTSNNLQLDSVTVVTGPNESGKSAAANALQLAVTGRCEIGSQASAQAKLLSSNTASVTAWGKGIEASWALRGGKKHWDDPETQGGLPVTVDEFWSLTGAERLKLIAPPGALTSIESKIAALNTERKQLKTIIDAPAPVAPDEYTGEPISVLENKIQGIRQELQRHRDALNVSKNNQQATENLERLREKHKALLSQVLVLDARVEAVTNEHLRASEQLAIYQESSAKEPRIIASARERGVSARVAIGDTLRLVSDAAAWSSSDAAMKLDEVIPHFLDLVSNEKLADPENAIFCTDLDSDNPNGPNGKKIAQAVQILGDMKNSAINSALSARMDLDRIAFSIEKSNLTSEVNSSVILDEDTLMQKNMQLAELSAEMEKANAWSSYNSVVERQVKARHEAFERLEKVEGDLSAANRELTEKVDSLKGPIETKANEMLAAASQNILTVSVGQTGRGWSLDVSIDDIAIESLARSKRLLYGLCLVAAIHELSSAKSPLLVAECAEMDNNTLEKAIEAMKVKRKGNVILEHWSRPKSDVCLIDLTSGVLV